MYVLAYNFNVKIRVPENILPDPYEFMFRSNHYRFLALVSEILLEFY